MDKLHQVAQFLFDHEKMSGEEFAQMMETPAVPPVEPLEQEAGEYWKVDGAETSKTDSGAEQE